jgi:hypothetical protein
LHKEAEACVQRIAALFSTDVQRAKAMLLADNPDRSTRLAALEQIDSVRELLN